MITVSTKLIEPNKMSGRGRGRGCGRGRSSGRGRSRAKKPETTKVRKTLANHMYYTGSNQASDYITISKFIVNHIRQKYQYGDDIGTALESKTPYNVAQHKPKLARVPTTITDEDERKAEEEENRTIYQTEVKSISTEK